MVRAVQIFRLYHQNCVIFEKILARDIRRNSNFQTASTNLPYFLSHIKKNVLFLTKIFLPPPPIIGPVQFSSDIIKSALFLQKCQLVIIGAGQISISLQQNRFIFGKISARDNRGIPNFQVTS